MRAEWRSTLEAAVKAAVTQGTAPDGGGEGGGGGGRGRGRGVSPDVDVAHCLDTCRSWFTADPISGEYDDGAWWDARLAELCAPYQTVVLLGESMGGTGALLHARHATRCGEVVSLVPQLDVRDFNGLNTRRDFGDARTMALRDALVASCAGATARITWHVGRDTADLQQIHHLPALRALYEAAGENAAAPLPRDGRPAECSRMESEDGRLRCFKHDVESHALGAGLKARGRPLHRVVFENLFQDLMSSSGSCLVIQ